ncbi:hypothetical protein K2X05_02365 [bacterium]|nr:hypothetical protein [bacterium]
MILFMQFNASADAPFHRREDLQQWGFKKYATEPVFLSASFSQNLEPQNLPFPIDLRFDTDQFGAVMHQFQDWTSPPYFHAGIDIRGELHQEVYSPVFGRIEAGYYSYTDSFDGRSDKFFLPYMDVVRGKGVPPWGELYFEIAIIDPNGYRYEFHHIDAKTLPDTIIAKISSGGSVAPGEFVGSLVEWPRKLFDHVYHHVHYNVISPDGVYLNPFKVSEAVVDSISPEIVNIYATQKARCGTAYRRLVPHNEEISMVTEDDLLVVEAFDQIQQGLARHMPAIIRADFENAPSFSWNFSEALILPNGDHPNITKIYLYYLCDEKDWLQNATKSFRFYIQIPLPKNYSGPVGITVTDDAGNSSLKTVLVGK